jgi:hypothetical protein
MDVVAYVTHVQPVPFALLYAKHRVHMIFRKRDIVDRPPIETTLGCVLLGRGHFDDLIRLWNHCPLICGDPRDGRARIASLKGIQRLRLPRDAGILLDAVYDLLRRQRAALCQQRRSRQRRGACQACEVSSRELHDATNHIFDRRSRQKAAAVEATRPTAWWKVLTERVLHRHSQFDPVIRSVDQILLRPEVPLGRLDGCVPEEQLNLLQFAARRAAQLRAGPTIMPHAA